MKTVFPLFSLLLFSLGCLEGDLGLIEVEKPPVGGDGSLTKPPYREIDPDNRNSDADCDGIPDWEELTKIYANGLKTDPQNGDTDGDGILDGVELGRTSSPDPACADYFPKNLSATGRTLTDPTRVDTDCDGVSDGDEDKDGNGRVDPGESDPTQVDSDDDGLWDGVELGLTQGLLLKGVVVAHPDPSCEAITKYADICVSPASRRITDPSKADTDGDGIWDGAEDSNKNGCFEPELGETDPTDPNSPNRTTEPEVWNACAAENLVPVNIQRNLAAQMALGLPMGFANSYVDIQRGNTHGLMGVDTLRNVAFVAWLHPGAVADLAALRALATTHVTNLGGTPPPQVPFASWDRAGWGTPAGTDNALSIAFQISGSTMSPAGRANDIANRLLGNGAGLANTGATGGPQHVRAQYVLRDNGEVVVVMAVALGDTPGSMEAFALADVAGGAALASYFDRTVVQCERGVAVNGAVDFLFVVDDSGSMGTAQNAVSTAATTMAEALNNSSLDWRAAVVTSSYSTTRNFIRYFTRDSALLQAWLGGGSCSEQRRAVSCSGNNPNSRSCSPVTSTTCAIGTNGNGLEGMLGSARLAIWDMFQASINMGTSSHTAADVRFRPDAVIVVVIITDTEDQTSRWNETASGQSSWENIENFRSFFRGEASTAASGHTLPAVLAGREVWVDAIYCPAGAHCGDMTVPTHANTGGISRIQRIVNDRGGILTPIGLTQATRNIEGIQRTMREIVDRTIGERGVETQKPFIGASLRVAIRNATVGTCDRANVPRSRQHGFDYDGIRRTISFFGNCRPAVDENGNRESPVAISYRAWEAADDSRWPCESDLHFEPNEEEGFCTGRFTCDLDKDVCICPELCGGCPASAPVCSPNTCECTPNLA